MGQNSCKQPEALDLSAQLPVLLGTGQNYVMLALEALLPGSGAWWWMDTITLASPTKRNQFPPDRAPPPLRGVPACPLLQAGVNTASQLQPSARIPSSRLAHSSPLRSSEPLWGRFNRGFPGLCPKPLKDSMSTQAPSSKSILTSIGDHVSSCGQLRRRSIVEGEPSSSDDVEADSSYKLCCFQRVPGSRPQAAAQEGTRRRESRGERERGSGKAGGWLTRKLRPLPRGLYFGDPVLQIIGLRARCRGRGKTGAPTPTPRLGESIPLPSRDREPGFSSTRAAGRRQGGSRHAATLPPFPGPPAPRRGPGALDSALKQTFPGPRRLEEPAPSTYLRPSGSRAQLGRRAGVCLRGPRSVGRDAGPQPRQAVLSPRKPGRASGAGNSAPAKGEVEVERGARSVPAAAGTAVPRPPPRPPFLPARLPPPPRARDSPRRRGRLVRAGEAQGSPTLRAANGKLEGEMQIPGKDHLRRRTGGQEWWWMMATKAAADYKFPRKDPVAGLGRRPLRPPGYSESSPQNKHFVFSKRACFSQGIPDPGDTQFSAGLSSTRVPPQIWGRFQMSLSPLYLDFEIHEWTDTSAHACTHTHTFPFC
ncbi:serine/arginine repetitive matrix protein 1-like [Pan troglodytes]|uniref:serine/arginine repetitive matrix protein 1-like n=1 Tax=Pan troglodytes TaxID=9598 RepID=UPI003013923D